MALFPREIQGKEPDLSAQMSTDRPPTAATAASVDSRIAVERLILVEDENTSSVSYYFSI